MKPSTNSATIATARATPQPIHDHKSAVRTMKRAKRYAHEAMQSPILYIYYAAMARTMKLRCPADAAVKDFLRNEEEVRERTRKKADTKLHP